MSLWKQSLKAAEAIRNEDDIARSRQAARLSPLETKEDASAAPESDLAHALRTRRMLRTPLSETR